MNRHTPAGKRTGGLVSLDGSMTAAFPCQLHKCRNMVPMTDASKAHGSEGVLALTWSSLLTLVVIALSSCSHKASCTKMVRCFINPGKYVTRCTVVKCNTNLLKEHCSLKMMLYKSGVRVSTGRALRCGEAAKLKCLHIHNTRGWLLIEALSNGTTSCSYALHFGAGCG